MTKPHPYYYILNAMNALPKNAYTKFCRFMYKGCTDLSCTFAHTEKELRNSIEEGTQDVRFVLPPSDAFPLSFVVQIDVEDKDDDEDDLKIDIEAMEAEEVYSKEEMEVVPSRASTHAPSYVPASITLNQICTMYQSEEWLDYYSLFLAERQATHQAHRIWNMVREYAKVTAIEGEMDMDISV